MNEEQFENELKKIGIIPTKKQLLQLSQYYDLLREWNEKINLTSIIEKEDVYLKHFYDSLTIYKAINLDKYNSLCDIGTGAGFPGIVIKIFFPHLDILLIDSLNKRINFLKTVIEKLGLKNINAVHERIEDYGKKNRNKFEITTARAVTNLSALLEYAIPVTTINGYFVPLKGSVDEISQCQNAFKLLNCVLKEKIDFNLPIEQSKRSIYVIKKIGDTSDKYPRSYNEIKKKSL